MIASEHLIPIIQWHWVQLLRHWPRILVVGSMCCCHSLLTVISDPSRRMEWLWSLPHGQCAVVWIAQLKGYGGGTFPCSSSIPSWCLSAWSACLFLSTWHLRALRSNDGQKWSSVSKAARSLLFACWLHASTLWACVMGECVVVGWSANQFGSLWFVAAEGLWMRVSAMWFSPLFFVPWMFLFENVKGGSQSTREKGTSLSLGVPNG